MDPQSIWIANLVYVLFLLLIGGTTYYMFGWRGVWWVIFVMIFFFFLTCYIGMINMEPVHINHCESYQVPPLASRYKDKDFMDDILHRPLKIDPILQKRDDKITAIDLSKSELHDIDE